MFWKLFNRGDQKQQDSSLALADTNAGGAHLQSPPLAPERIDR